MNAGVRHGLRTLVGPWGVIVVLGLDLGIALMRGSPYRGDQVFTVRWMALSLWLIWVVTAALAALDASKLSGEGRSHLIRTAAGGRRVLPAAALATGVPLALLHGLAVGAALVLGGARVDRAGWGVVALAVAAQCATVLWFACVGSFLGRYLPPLVAGPAGAVAAFVLPYVVGSRSTGEPRFSPLGDLGASVSQIGVTWDVGFLGLQILVLAVTGAVLVSAPLHDRTTRRVLMPVGVAAASAAVLTVSMGVGPDDAVVLQARPAGPDECRGSDPEVCYYPEHRQWAAERQAVVTRLVEGATAAGYDHLVPSRVIERSQSYGAAGLPDVAVMEPLEPGSDDDEITWVAQTLVMPRACARLDASSSEPPPEEYFEDVVAVSSTWAALADPSYVDWTGTRPAVLSPEDVGSIVDRWSSCELAG